MNTAMSPDYDGSGYDRRPAMTGAETEVRALLNVALNAIVGADVGRGDTWDGAFRSDLRQACDAARRHGLRAEQFVVILKRTWADEWRGRVLSRQQAVYMLERLVADGITEFYGNHNDESLESASGRRHRTRDEAEA